MKNLKVNLPLVFVCITSALCAQLQTPLVNPTDTLASKQKIRVKEYGIGFTGLNSYSLQYRWGTPKVLYRINANVGFTGLSNANNNTDNYQNNTGSFSASSDNVQIKTPATISTAIGFSVLTLKQINPKFGIVLGGTAGLTYSYTTGQNIQASTYQDPNNFSVETVTTKSTTQTLQPYMGFVLGAYYKINPSFIIYAEIAPNIYYASSQTKSTSNTTYYPPTTDTRSSTTSNTSANLGLSGLSNSGAMLTLVYRITKTKNK
jgi:hypothetical protein